MGAYMGINVKHKLTSAVLERFQCPPDKQQVFIWDASLSGFGVRCTQSGAKSYILQTRVHGKPVRLTIGSCSTWLLQEARSQARELLVKIDKGVDPRAEAALALEQAKTMQAAATTKTTKLVDLWPRYLEEGAPRKKSAFKPVYLHHMTQMGLPGGIDKIIGRGKTVKGPLWNVLQLSIDEINVYSIRDWFKSELKTRPGQAVKALRILQGFLRWVKAMNADMKAAIDVTIFGEPEIKDLIPARKVRTDNLPAAYVHKWIDEVHALRDKTITAYLLGLLLTGCRREELAQLKWSDISRTGLMTIRDKVHITRTIPVGCVFQNILDALPRTSEYVFPTSNPLKSKTGYLGDPRASMDRATKAAGLDALSIHGLRRTYALMADAAGVPTGAAAQIMGHSTKSIIAGYRPRTAEELIEFADKIQRHIYKRESK